MEFLDCFETIIQSIIIPEYRFFLVKQQTIDRNQAKLERFFYTQEGIEIFLFPNSKFFILK